MLKKVERSTATARLPAPLDVSILSIATAVPLNRFRRPTSPSAR